MSDIITAQSSSQEDPLSIEQACAMVDDLISKGSKLFVELAKSETVVPDGLGPATRSFFSKYSALQTRRGGFRLAAADVRASEYVSGYLSIGHSEDWDVVQQPGRDEVFVVEGGETCEAEMEVRYMSVYHLVLDEARESSTAPGSA